MDRSDFFWNQAGVANVQTLDEVTGIDDTIDARATDIAKDLDFADEPFGNDIAEQVATGEAIAGRDLAGNVAFGEDAELHRAHVFDVDVGDSADGSIDIGVLIVVSGSEDIEIGACTGMDAAGEGAWGQTGDGARGHTREDEAVRTIVVRIAGVDLAIDIARGNDEGPDI